MNTHFYSIVVGGVISLFVFIGIVIFLVPATTSASTGVCWLTEAACSRESIDGLPYNVPSYIDDKEGWNESTSLACAYKHTPSGNDDSVQLGYKCYGSEAEALLEYEYSTGQKIRPNMPEGFRRKSNTCRTTHNSYECGEYVLMGRNVVKVEADIPFTKIPRTSEMKDKGIAAAQKRLEVAKIAALKLSPEEKPSTGGVEGRAYALDFLDLEQPIPYAKIELEIGGSTYTDYTDIDGGYSFDVSTEATEGKITLTLGGYRDEKNTFEVVDDSVSTDVVTVWRDISIDEETDFIVDVALGGEYMSSSKKTKVRGLIDHYYHLSQAMDFAELVLMTDVSQLRGRDILPITVFAYSTNADSNAVKSTYYDPEFGAIYLATSDSGYYSTESPFPLFHEFGHHIMFVLYSPSVSSGEIDTGISFNHGGIMNQTTADSVSEGLPTFLALLMAQEYDHAYPHVYEPSPVAFGRNWEVNYKAWDMEGTLSREEFAFTALLNDLVDTHRDKGDDVQIEFSKLWNVVIDHENQTVKDFYDALIALYDKAKIDALFIEHGFFWDKQEGNRALDVAGTHASADGKTCRVKGIEPGLDINKDGQIETHTEVWMDYSNWHQYPCMPAFDEGDEVGFTGSYQTKERKTFTELPNRFMEVDNGVYELDFSFPEYPEYDYSLSYNIRNGRLPVIFPPAQYEGEVQINEDLKLSSDEYYEAIEETVGEDSFRSEKSSSGFGFAVGVFVLLFVGYFYYRNKLK